MNGEATEALQQYQAEAPDFLAVATELVIEDGADYQAACETLQEVKVIRATIEEERTRITQPMNASLKATNAFFGKADEPYETVEKLLRQKTSEFLALERKRESEAIAAAKDSDALAIATQATPSIKGITQRATYSAVVEDESLLPDEWWVRDDKGLQALAKSSKGRAKVPGVKFIIGTAVTVGRG